MGLLGRLAENRRANTKPEESYEQIENNDSNEIQGFEFEGEKYYMVIRDNVLIFDSNMILIHTLTRQEVVVSQLPLIKKAGELIATKDDANVKLFVKRNGMFEKLSFYNTFDAEFIMKKLKRVASRPDESIEEIFIESDGAIYEHYFANQWHRRFNRNVFHRKDDTETIMEIANVEETLDSLISELVNGTVDEIPAEKIDKCIEMLENLKNK